MNKEELDRALNRLGIRPRKEQGQNFLIDQTAVDASIDAGNLTKEDIVLEIGPGFGALTKQLVEIAGKVIAVEQDWVLCKALKKFAEKHNNLIITNEDIRTFHREKAGLEDLGYKLIANLPYNITSWILREFVEKQPRPNMMVVMVQKEVAERITSKAGKMSILSCAMQLFAEPEIVRIVDRESFHPIPNVDSAILQLTIREEVPSKDPQQLMKLIKIAFAARRKQIPNNISNGLAISATQVRIIMTDIGLNPAARPQELSIDDWEAFRLAILKEVSL